MLVMELVNGGSLDRHLQLAAGNKTSQSPAAKGQFCLDAARGIDYLHGKNFLHRDIAARNCLVACDRRHKKYTVKISDFGMCKETEDGTYSLATGNARLPVKWLAPECIQDSP